MKTCVIFFDCQCTLNKLITFIYNVINNESLRYKFT